MLINPQKTILGLGLSVICVAAPSANAAAYFTDTGVQTLGNPQSLGGVNHTDESVAFELTFDFTIALDGETVPVLLWEFGATGSGSALVLEGDELHFFAGNDTSQIVTANHGLTSPATDVQIVSVFELNSGTTTPSDELLSLYVNGSLIGSAEYNTADIWAGSDGGGIGTVDGGADRYNNGTPPFTPGDVIDFPSATNISLSVWQLASSGGAPENTLGNILVPEPSTTALLGLGGLALILRRRK